MNKKFLSTYLPFLISLTIFFIGFSCYQIFNHGFLQGMHLVFLAWSLYILCIPAAHGRILIGGPSRIIFRKKILPEPYLWTLAAAINIVSLIFTPDVYHHTLPTYLLYRILTIPKYWIILVIGVIGTWYRVICGTERYKKYDATHTIIRHLILLFGLLVLFYMTNYDVIVMINVMASG